VQLANSLWIVLWITASVCASTDAVASSSTRMRLFFNSARPRQNSCRCPTLQFSPFSSTAIHKNPTLQNSKPLPLNSSMML
jgi:hypothetical protein